MPVWDLVAVVRLTLRYAFIIGIISYIVGITFLLGDGIESLWTIVSTSVDSLQDKLAYGSSGTLMSCFYYVLHGLGFDTSLSSFIAASIGLMSVWAALVGNMMLFQFTLFLKGYLLESTR